MIVLRWTYVLRGSVDSQTCSSTNGLWKDVSQVGCTVSMCNLSLCFYYIIDVALSPKSIVTFSLLWFYLNPHENRYHYTSNLTVRRDQLRLCASS
jgi:hypothetical protein